MTLHVSDRFTFHRQESSTVYTAIVMCHTGYADSISGLRSPLASRQHNLYDIPIAVYTVLDS
jgi:hypothetical protein